MIQDPYGLYRVFRENDFLVFDTSALKFSNNSYDDIVLRMIVKPVPIEAIQSEIRYIERIKDLVLSTDKIKIPKVVIEEEKNGLQGLRTKIYYKYRLSLEGFIDACLKKHCVIYDPNKHDLDNLKLKSQYLKISENDCNVLASATALDGKVALLSCDFRMVNALFLELSHKSNVRPYTLINEETFTLRTKPFKQLGYAKH